jgi:hypothetical protein
VLGGRGEEGEPLPVRRQGLGMSGERCQRFHDQILARVRSAHRQLPSRRRFRNQAQPATPRRGTTHPGNEQRRP